LVALKGRAGLVKTKDFHIVVMFVVVGVVAVFAVHMVIIVLVTHDHALVCIVGQEIGVDVKLGVEVEAT
jgi:hypothetical protein